MQIKYLNYIVWILLFAAESSLAVDMPIPAAPEVGAKGYLIIDTATGRELAAKDPDKRLAPASLTKLMTAYAIFQALKEGRITLEDVVTVSEKAWRTQGSRMFIEVGKRIKVQDLVLGMIVQSGNDASVALAEHVAGSEAVFAEVMNRYALNLGMHSSHFENATGLPGKNHYSTARDLATLARAIIGEFPDYYRWYSVREFTFADITQKNRNALLWRDSSVDGMKTGHTDAAGYCLVSSAKRNGMRLVAVVLGASSPKIRTDASQSLLNYGFRFYETRLLYSAGEEVTNARIWKGSSEYTSLGVERDLFVTIPRGRFAELDPVLEIPSILMAPVAVGQPLGQLRVSLGDETVIDTPLRALSEISEGSLWQRMRDEVKLWFE